MKKVQLFILCITIFLSCKEFKSHESISIIEKNTKDKVFLEVLTEQDTLQFPNTIKGKVRFFSKNDSTKTEKTDKRNIFLDLALYPTNRIEKDTVLIERFSREIALNDLNLNDTLQISFSFPSSFVGKGKIVGVISDILVLHSSSSNGEVRVVNNEYEFEKDVFIANEGM